MTEYYLLWLMGRYGVFTLQRWHNIGKGYRYLPSAELFHAQMKEVDGNLNILSL